VLHSITYDIDAKHGTALPPALPASSCAQAQRANIIVGAGMTDPKGDRSKRPHEQADPDMFLHVVKRTDDGRLCHRVRRRT
jgi:4-hydroxybutyryl-CoA dehydratase/vinylacetyl-CoA-Delta-isomerase